MLRFVRLTTLVLLTLLVGCSDSASPIFLGLNRSRWDKQNLHDYVYTSRMGCFCPQSGQEVSVTVVADTVVSVRDVGIAGEELPKSGWYSVTQLFDLLARTRGQNYSRVKVEYDPELGYPTRINLACGDTVLDCGLTIEARNLRRIAVLE